MRSFVIALVLCLMALAAVLAQSAEAADSDAQFFGSATIGLTKDDNGGKSGEKVSAPQPAPWKLYAPMFRFLTKTAIVLNVQSEGGTERYIRVLSDGLSRRLAKDGLGRNAVVRIGGTGSRFSEGDLILNILVTKDNGRIDRNQSSSSSASDSYSSHDRRNRSSASSASSSYHDRSAEGAEEVYIAIEPTVTRWTKSGQEMLGVDFSPISVIESRLTGAARDTASSRSNSNYSSRWGSNSSYSSTSQSDSWHRSGGTATAPMESEAVRSLIDPLVSQLWHGLAEVAQAETAEMATVKEKPAPQGTDKGTKTVNVAVEVD